MVSSDPNRRFATDMYLMPAQPVKIWDLTFSYVNLIALIPFGSHFRTHRSPDITCGQDGPGI